MRVTYKKRFLQDLNRIPDPFKEKIQEIVFEQIPYVKNIQQISGLKKLKGYTESYRVRFSDYRIGLSVKEDRVVFFRVLHRKDIYKYFP